jgi:hypothetical protein
VGRCIHFVHLTKMEFKLKLCFQNDLIRFIGDKLDKICPFSAKCTCTKLLSLFSPFYLNLPKVDFFICFCMKTKLYQNKLGIFFFLPQGRYFLLYMYNFCIKCHLLIYGYIKVWPVKNPRDQILSILC